jgi:hypothetical protein
MLGLAPSIHGRGAMDPRLKAEDDPERVEACRSAE